MDVITYSLRNGQARSDQYYRDVAAFTDQVLAEAKSRIRSLVEAFQSYLQANSREVSRTGAEYTFELLTLGVWCYHFWRGIILCQREWMALGGPSAWRGLARYSIVTRVGGLLSFFRRSANTAGRRDRR